ncbi:transglycosylase SLT domain-containing protein [Modicisalibacter tunisiensis]|uniref:Transglycosylase SLT domain-containing protein n=1 Tax=Modicisalibacter tunisiensis TaxID=390637 RepID=A0ABS7X2C1_9GAMM|nr:transglycosylase SLT domain-containing protein [Modicisalibacter tunisiensis]MBZ9569043.1 transglycosylase SLT domain-containing protein [Modicisalibacter tunisiensis]
MPLRIPRHGLALLSALLLSLPAVADEAGDQALREALDAARAHQWSRIDDTAIDHHVLAGYIAYHRLRDRLPDVPPAEVKAFIDRHADSPLSSWLRGVAEVAYGKAGRLDDLLAVSDGEPRGVIRRCYYYTALLDKAPGRAAEGGRKLWLTGHSQPGECDTLFDTLRQRGEIAGPQIWQRLLLAWENGETGLMHYLDGLLPAGWGDAKSALARLRKDYAAITRVPRDVGPKGASGPLFAAAMHQFTRADTEAALEAWRKIAPHLDLDARQRQTIERDLAFYSMVREVDNNRGWVDQVLPDLGDSDLLELRVRRALADRDWQGVIDWVHAMPDDPRQDARWQYWLGRALAELGDAKTARKAYAAAAGQRSFYGFAAADRLGQPYDLNLQRATFNEAYRRQVADWPVIRRVEALMRIGEPGLARSEWYFAARRADTDRANAMADYAMQQGWYALAVQTTILAREWDALAWRFPLAYRDAFQHWGQRLDVDPYLLMGIARRESAFNPQAQSAVGARGLMQLMPATARHVSAREELDAPDAGELFDPAVNIRLGSHYVREMLDRYRGNRLAAVAAYNAGPSRVDRWLRDAPQDFDLFVESIPYHETRAYVQAVLTYRVIFASLARGGDTSQVALLADGERQSRYDASLLASN